jgi:hypothetical protein
MAAETKMSRADKLEMFVELDALATVLSNIGEVLEPTMPNSEIDDIGQFGAPYASALWPGQWTEEARSAEDRSALKAALILFALADNAELLRAEGVRLVANEERLLREGREV